MSADTEEVDVVETDDDTGSDTGSKRKGKKGKQKGKKPKKRRRFAIKTVARPAVVGVVLLTVAEKFLPT